VGEHASILTKVNILVSLQSIEICDILCNRAKIQKENKCSMRSMVTCNILKDNKCSMSNIVMCNIVFSEVRMSMVTVNKAIRSSKEVRGHKTVQYICRTWVKLVLKRVPCTVNKHSGKCTAVYSTNRQSEYVTNVERYPGPAKVYKVTIYILVNNVCKKRMVMDKWYVNYGMCSIGNIGCYIRTVMTARYVEYMKEEKRSRVNKTKVSNVRKYRNKKYKTILKDIHGKYSSITVALEKLNAKRYKYLAGAQVYKCCIRSESIDVYIGEKVGGNMHSEPVIGKSIRYKYIAGTQVYKRYIMSESINVYIEEKAGGNRYREPVLGKSIKKGKVKLKQRPQPSWNIEALAEAQNELVCEARKDSMLNKPNVSVSVKMDQRVNTGDQEMETNPPQQAAPSGEYCPLSVPSASMMLCPVYVMIDPNNIHPIVSSHYNVRVCYICRMCRNCRKCRICRKSYKLEIRSCPIIHIYVCTVRRNVINISNVAKHIKCYAMSYVVQEESSWYGRYGE
jgi:hypothetical protein